MFVSASVGLGIILAFQVLEIFMNMCSFFGLNEVLMFRTDDRTVWLLAIPLVAFPIYVICMFVGRAAGK